MLLKTYNNYLKDDYTNYVNSLAVLYDKPSTVSFSGFPSYIVISFNTEREQIENFFKSDHERKTKELEGVYVYHLKKLI